MKYNCDMIADLLPLYCDGVCSAESRAIVEEHLSGCDACSKLYSNMQADAAVETVRSEGKDVLGGHKKRIAKRIAAAVLICTVLLTSACAGLYYLMVKDNGKTDYTDIIIGESSVYSQEELEAAVDAVLREFRSSFDACVMLNISFDEEVSNQQTKWDEEENIIALSSTLYIRGFSSQGFEPYMVYERWMWTVQKNPLGGWTVLSEGYA